MEKLGWVGNFRAAAEGRLPADRQGVVFTDSDVYKLMEGAAWEVGRSGSTDADDRFVELTGIIAPAQEDDGYLNTVFGRPGQPARYSDLEWGHELYCYGHMLQAAVARARTGRDDLFVEVARRAADHVCQTFGPGGIERVGGHPEIELGLVELARLTGEERYLQQAKLFIDRRGHQTLADIHWGRSYFQDDVPVRDQVAFTGHSVRALYLAAAAVDVAVETGDEALLEAIIAQWERTIARRTYLTGGMGSHHDGERFGEDFVLPPDRAYSETCAGVASVMLAWRLLLATGEHRFADLGGAHPVQRGGHISGARWAVLLLRKPLAPTRSRRGAVTRFREQSGGVEPSRAMVCGVLLPDQHRPHLRLACGLPGDSRRPRASDPPVRRQHHLDEPGGRAAGGSEAEDRVPTGREGHDRGDRVR